MDDNRLGQSTPNHRPTLVLTRAQIGAFMTASDDLVAAEEAFRALATGQAVAPPPLHISVEHGGFHAKAACLASYAVVKVNANFPSNPKANGLPTIQGAIVLCDARNGRLLAVMDTTEVTLRRTAAATALAATRLARPNAEAVAIIGCGAQSRAQLAALASEFRLRRVLVWDIDGKAAAALAADVSTYLGFPVEHAGDMRAATRSADIVVTCTTSSKAFLDEDAIRPGTFVAAVGADHPHKSEIAPRLMARAKVVVDVLEQCAVMGDLHHAIAAGVMTARDVHASLGELVVGQRPGRDDAAEITLFDSTGTAAQDVTAAARIYERARAAGMGAIQNFNG